MYCHLRAWTAVVCSCDDSVVYGSSGCGTDFGSRVWLSSPAGCSTTLPPRACRTGMDEFFSFRAQVVTLMAPYFQTIVDADLVVWATLGSTVLPVTEDVPSPSTAVHNHRLLLTPHNYFDVGPATVLSEVVRITGSLSDAGTCQDEGLVQSTELKFSGTLLDPPNCVQRERRLDGFSGLVPSVEG